MQLAKRAVGGVPPVARLGGSPPGKFSEINPISCNLRDSEIIFIAFSKVFYNLRSFS